MEEEEALADHLRCSRTDGRQWRCKRRVMENMKLCEIHYLQGRHRQYKEKVPESLKLQRKKKSKKSQGCKETASSEFGIRVERVKMKRKVKKPARVSGSEAALLDETLRKMKSKKKGNLQLELIRMVLKRDLEKKKKNKKKKKKSDFPLVKKKKNMKTKQNEIELEDNSEEEEEEEEELTRQLPNGVMAISPVPSPSPRNFNNVDGNCDVKVGVENGVARRRCFRSKNIEPLPFGTMQLMPCGQNVAESRRGKRKRRCHCCRKSGSLSLVSCSSCQKEFFCADCIKERYFDTQEDVKMACPVCRGTCTCKDCSANQSKDRESKDSLGEENKVEKILRFHYLICMLLPVLKRMNHDRSVELETEANTNGKKTSEVHIKQSEFGCNEQNCCSNCKTSIVDLHRSCPNCSYNLCLSCCKDFCCGSFTGRIDTFISKNSNGRKACISGDKQLSLKKLAKQNSGTYLSSPASVSDWKACNANGRISCPPAEFGGCGDSFLDLRCVFSLSWIKELEVSAEEIVCSYEVPEAFDISSCCSVCLDIDHKADGIEHLQEAAAREDSIDNYLYYPTLLDVHNDKLEHFQKHWGRGHPVIVRNVLQSASDLNWDPVVMFCTYLEQSIARYENNKDFLEATNCLDWCEVEIGIRQYFMGSLNGQTHKNTWQEKFKLKGWLSSHLFQEQFPSHYAQIIHSLPLQEYMNPISGLLNLAAKLPQEIPKPDLGPCVYISYGYAEELIQADSVAKLCYDSYDVVNILAHTTDAPISAEQLTKIRKLLKKHNSQCQRESSRTTDQIKANKVNKKLSNGENIEDSGLQNITGEEMHLRKRVARVSCFSPASHEKCARSLKNSKMSQDEGYDSDSDFDTEASLSSNGPVLSSQTSDKRKFGNHSQNSNSYRKKLFSESSGAQWDVFRRQDVPKLIEYLQRHSNEFSHMSGLHKHVVHPILDQSVFLDTTHKMRLKEEFEIEPWTFEQRIGEAVIIPAGCPYQIRNPKSCVHVVLDFVSPENVTECIHLIDEVRLLPEDHKAKVDKLEVKKMALHSISAAVKEIRELTCTM
ncbi:lysine-specific demethylase JMJ28 isoform X3 [Quercus robur]|nr:lysine-specific demethylase JMJ28 isoform X3 [Quercus robur]